MRRRGPVKKTTLYYLATGGALVSPSVYVSVVLKAARVLEQLATLVTGVAAGATAVQSLLHAVREVLRQ